MSVLSTIKSKAETFLVAPAKEVPSNDDDNENSESSNPQQHQPTLQITSYDRFTPPDPKPDLEYDCRLTKIPPRQVRLVHTGLDDKLQDELMSRDEFHDLLKRAEEEIRKLMDSRKARAKGEDDAAVLRVGCLCGSGHHRSVAFAEQLGKIEWPERWDVRVNHRDLTDEVREEKRSKAKIAVREAKERKMTDNELR